MLIYYIGMSKLGTIFLNDERRFEYITLIEVRKRAKIRNRYNQAPHLIQDTNGKVTTSQLDIAPGCEKIFFSAAETS